MLRASSEHIPPYGQSDQILEKYCKPCKPVSRTANPGPNRIGTPYIFFVAFSEVNYYDVMARLARVVVPGVPHHVTQRGNRRHVTFFNEADYAAYLDLMTEWCGRCGVAVWAYCLMPNHVHLIVVPESEDGLRRVFTA